MKSVKNPLDASLISGPLLTLALFDEFVQLRLADIVEPKTVINNSGMIFLSLFLVFSLCGCEAGLTD
jgi:hypothetical protein